MRVFSDRLAESQASARRVTGSASAASATSAGPGGRLLPMTGPCPRMILDNHRYRGLIASGRQRMAAISARPIGALAWVRSLLYGDGRTVRTFAGDSAKRPGSG